MEKEMQLRLNQAKERLKDIDLKLEDPDVVKDLDAFRKLSKEKANLDPIIEKYDEYLKLVSDREDALLMLKDSDEEIIKFAKETIDNIDKELIDIEEQLKILLVPKDPNDDKNIVVEIRGAVGGDEANIFAGDLFRMYVKYAEKKGWKLQLIDESPSGVGGYSLVSFMIKGEGVYSRLKFESGAHRVQRVPKTEANGRIHTSTATVLVMPEAEEIDITINNADLHVDTYRSQGAGGQNVNKTESAVRITHLPTGIVVSCQTEKAQLQNKEICMRMIRAKVQDYYQSLEDNKRATERKLKVGTGERSEKIRTYNYPQNRVTDHRIGFTINQLDRVMEGELDPVIDALIHFDQEQKLLEEVKRDEN